MEPFYDDGEEGDYWMKHTVICKGGIENYREYIKKEIIGTYKKWMAGATGDVKRYNDEIAEWTDVLFKNNEVYLAKKISDYEGCSIDKDGNLYNLENPNGKWDWWMVGGRYSDYLIDKNKVTRLKCKVKEVSFENILERLKDKTDGRLHRIEDTAPYAFLHDGKWTQIEDSHDEVGVGAKVFFEMFNSLDPETEITIIDYHM
jgi:hypothetical protein